MQETNLLVLDTNKWLKVIEETSSRNVAARWKAYLREYNFDIVLSDLILQELADLLADKDSWPNRNRKITLLRLMQIGKTFDFRHVKTEKEAINYHFRANMILHRKIKKILGKEKYRACPLHTKDLEILLSLKELGRPFYFITHDRGLLGALQCKEIRDILIEDGLYLILLHETQGLKTREITRVKVFPEYP